MKLFAKIMLYHFSILFSMGAILFLFYTFLVGKEHVSFKCQIPKDMIFDTIEVHEDSVIFESSERGFFVLTDSCLWNEMGYHHGNN